MYNESFYPTPPEVARRMFERLGRNRLATSLVLEPSAGKGDLADALCEYLGGSTPDREYGRHLSRAYAEKIHCLEIEPELQAALRGKNYRLVGKNFLTWEPDELYDCIIMNPPFANGEDHLLHAWEILSGGDILCLLNESTVKNPNTARRRQLAAVIEQHGQVEYLGSCFSEAFRKTGVAVALVHLTKEKPKVEFSFGVFEKDGSYQGFDTSTLEGQVATRNTIGNLVLEFGKSLACFDEAGKAVAELAYYSRHLRGEYGGPVRDAMKDALAALMEGSPTSDNLEHAHNKFSRALKKAAWEEVFRLSKFSSLISRSVKNDFERLQKENEGMAFSQDNIASLLETLFMSRDQIMRQCILDAFNHLTHYYKENRMTAEGWKSNDSWRVNRRVVLPYMVSSWVYGLPHIDYGSRHETLMDIDRALAYLEGRKFDDIVTVCEAFDRQTRAWSQMNVHWAGRKFESSHFECHAYKKGTLHLFFKDKALWERFNLEAARGKNWLPDDVKAREKEERANTRKNTQTAEAAGPKALPLLISEPEEDCRA